MDDLLVTDEEIMEEMDLVEEFDLSIPGDELPELSAGAAAGFAGVASGPAAVPAQEGLLGAGVASVPAAVPAQEGLPEAGVASGPVAVPAQERRPEEGAGNLPDVLQEAEPEDVPDAEPGAVPGNDSEEGSDVEPENVLAEEDPDEGLMGPPVPPAAPAVPAVPVPAAPPDPASAAAASAAPEVAAPKAYVRPRPDAGNLSYGRRAAIYLSDKDEYRSMIGGNRQWK